MAAPGVSAAACPPRRLPTPVWIGCGHGGSNRAGFDWVSIGISFAGFYDSNLVVGKRHVSPGPQQNLLKRCPYPLYGPGVGDR